MARTRRARALALVVCLAAARASDTCTMLRNDVCELADMSEGFRAQAVIDTGCAVVEFDTAAFPESETPVT